MHNRRLPDCAEHQYYVITAKMLQGSSQQNFGMPRLSLSRTKLRYRNCSVFRAFSRLCLQGEPKTVHEKIMRRSATWRSLYDRERTFCLAECLFHERFEINPLRRDRRIKGMMKGDHAFQGD